MKYLTLHQSEEDYANLILDANNTPHVALVVSNTRPVYTRKIHNTPDDMPDGYQLFNAADGEFLDKDNNQIYVK